MKLLLKSGADPNQESEYREIVLYFSPPASCVLSDSINKYAIAKILLQYNAKPENFGIVHSALDFAVEGNDSELVKILFEKGEYELNPSSFGKLSNLNLEGLSIPSERIAKHLERTSRTNHLKNYTAALIQAGVKLVQNNITELKSKSSSLAL